MTATLDGIIEQECTAVILELNKLMDISKNGAEELRQAYPNGDSWLYMSGSEHGYYTGKIIVYQLKKKLKARIEKELTDAGADRTILLMLLGADTE